MPQYKVIAPGFYKGEMYNPTGKRRVLTTDKPFSQKNPMPSWVIAMPDEDAAVKAKREAQEASRKAAVKSLTESVTKAEDDLKTAEGKLENAKTDEAKVEAEAEVYAAQLNLTDTKAALSSVNPEEEASTQDQVKIASTQGDGKETSFLGKVTNALTGNNNVETL